MLASGARLLYVDTDKGRDTDRGRKEDTECEGVVVIAGSSSVVVGAGAVFKDAKGIGSISVVDSVIGESGVGTETTADGGRLLRF